MRRVSIPARRVKEPTRTQHVGARFRAEDVELLERATELLSQAWGAPASKSEVLLAGVQVLVARLEEEAAQRRDKI